MNLPEPVMRGICLGRAGLVEVFLYNLRTKIDEYVIRLISFFESSNRHDQFDLYPLSVISTEWKPILVILNIGWSLSFFCFI
jgi:hypothetical protein